MSQIVRPLQDQSELAKEQANLILNETKKRVFEGYEQITKLVGKPVLIAIVALILGWFVFNLFSVTIPASIIPSTKIELSFWQSIGLVNNLTNLQSLILTGFQNAPKGFYGFLGIVALTGPFLFIFWKNPLAHLANLAPLIFMLLISAIAYMGYTDLMNANQEAVSKLGGGFGGEMMKSMTAGMFDNVMKMITIGIGAYLSVAASLYLGFIGFSKFLVASASNNVAGTASGTSAPRSSGRRSLQTSLATETSMPASAPVAPTRIPKAIETANSHCPVCKTKTEVDAAFCGDCGHKLA